MSGAMYVAAAGALLQQMRMEVLSNNLANINTVGFKNDQVVFRMEELLNQNTETIQDGTGESVQQLSPYSPPMDYFTDFSSGSLKQTGNALDVALTGDGFFTVQTPDGAQYTRKGNFTINDEGILTTQDGFPVMGDSGEITIDGSGISIDGQGEISVDGTVVDSLRIVTFNDKTDLIKAGNTQFKTVDPGNIGQQMASPAVSQGYLETSNVDGIRAMTEMIESTRLFESYQKAIKTQDETTAKAINDVGAPA